MLRDRACRAISTFLHYGCNKFRIFPYTWNPEKFQLEAPDKFHIIFYRSNMLVQYLLTAWILLNTTRAYLSAEILPFHVRALNAVWILGFGLSCVSYAQYDWRRAEIQHYANSLFAYIGIKTLKVWYQSFK